MPDIHEEISTRAFLLQRQMKETHQKRDPLKDIDKLAVPDTKVWGQARDPTTPAGKTDTIFDIKQGNESGPSDSDIRLEDEEGNDPTKGMNHKLTEEEKPKGKSSVGYAFGKMEDVDSDDIPVTPPPRDPKKKLTESEAISDDRTCAVCGRSEELHYEHGADKDLGHHFKLKETIDTRFNKILQEAIDSDWGKTKPYWCLECGKGYDSPAQVQKHMADAGHTK